MTKDQITKLVENRVTQERLKTFLNALVGDGFFEIAQSTDPELDYELGICLSEDHIDDRDDIGVALADLLGSDV